MFAGQQGIRHFWRTYFGETAARQPDIPVLNCSMVIEEECADLSFFSRIPHICQCLLLTKQSNCCHETDLKPACSQPETGL
jgi:hypothetical protein